MFSLRRVTTLFAVTISALALNGCGGTPVSTTLATIPAATTPATPAASAVAPSPAPTTVPTPAATATPTAPPTATSSAEATLAPIVTVVPGSSLDPTQSDAGIAGRFTIVDDTRSDQLGNLDHTGTHEIQGRKADGSDCSFSFEGDTYTAVAWYDAAPPGYLHQLAVSLPADEMPANDGEQRTSIVDGSVYADFSAAPDDFGGTAYSGSVNAETYPGMSTISIAQDGTKLTFDFSGTTWDNIDFSGQMICLNGAS